MMMLRETQILAVMENLKMNLKKKLSRNPISQLHRKRRKKQNLRQILKRNKRIWARCS